MNMRRYGSGPVRPEDVRDGSRQEKVVDVSINEKFDCLVLHFDSGDQFLLFQTNARAMNRAYTTESDNWLKQTVELALGHYTDSNGEEKETVVLRPISKLQPSADNSGTPIVPRLSRRDDLDDESDETPFN